MSERKRIKVTGVDLRKLIAAVYANSHAQGMGHMHFRAGEMPEKLVEEWLGTVKVSDTGCILHMDYVLGRACKFGLFRDEDGELWIEKPWFDHTEMDLARMLRDAGLSEDLANG